MKKLLFLLFIPFLACEDQNVETFCWNCRRDVFTSQGTYSVVIQVCGESEDSITRFEQDNTSINGTTTISMKCWKEGEQPKIK